MLLFIDKIIPPPCAQGTRRGVRHLRLMSDIHLQNYDLARTIQNKIVLFLLSSVSNFEATASKIQIKMRIEN